VFVHELEPEQAQRLVRIARTSKDRVRLRRAGIVLASVQARPVSVIAQMFAAAEGYVREVIHAFNDTGSPLWTPNGGGQPRKYGRVAHQLICQNARSTPLRAGPVVHHLEPDQAHGLPGRPLPTSGLHRDHPARAARGLDQLAGPQDVEGQSRPRLRGEMARILDLYDRSAAGQIPDGRPGGLRG
jgi:hypothetical protein